jgi:hypothetical protein
MPSRYLADWTRVVQRASLRPSMSTLLLSSEMPSLYCSTVGGLPRHVGREGSFGAVDQEVGRLPCRLGRLSTKPPECVGQFLTPLASISVSCDVQSLLEGVEYHPVGALDLSVGVRGWATETYRRTRRQSRCSRSTPRTGGC